MPEQARRSPRKLDSEFVNHLTARHSRRSPAYASVFRFS